MAKCGVPPDAGPSPEAVSEGLGAEGGGRRAPDPQKKRPPRPDPAPSPPTPKSDTPTHKRVAPRIPRSQRDARGRFLPGNAGAFKPGEVGNPKGRPKRKTVSELTYDALQAKAPVKLRRDAAKVIGCDPEALRGLSIIELTAATLAARGVLDLEAFREVHDRLDPKPRRVEVGGPDGGAVEVRLGRADLTEEEAEDVYRRARSGGEIVDVPADED